MFKYVCFYKKQQVVVTALRSFDAQQQAAKLLKAKRPYEVKVVLAATADGTPIPISTASL
jgi:hypothetical protein